MWQLPPLIKEHHQRESLRQQGCTPEQTARLVTYRAAYQTGHHQVDPDEYRRLVFTRWLYRSGNIQGRYATSCDGLPTRPAPCQHGALGSTPSCPVMDLGREEGWKQAARGGGRQAGEEPFSPA